MTNIRLATQQDLSGIVKLYKELRGHDPHMSEQVLESTWAEMLNNPGVSIVVAEVDGQLASTCQLGVVLTLTNGCRPFGIIEHVITAESFRRQGLSEQVLEKALSCAWEQDCYKVMLLSGATRTSAHKLYEKVGFKSGVESGFVIKSPVQTA
ncbi:MULTISPECIES: GNAT family N-acetyltransferase [Pseudoalteromonas]|uniref:GNAT family N-acetyltransferase n=1 Tax=Pseudoalteromonas TaxID=53246 RepID=UPI001EF47D29|nr:MULTISPECIES: GNAT family N-acetyltransferase [Pseudoalteromonas]MCG7564316.1 GNAT family N-acetyltransferase [Pseudoalteromonas sp. McH1-42]MEC4087791.1 GNAT family N-acetyltransferase [Pseudoalteromonas rubra]